ncbi:unnamed protein product [Rotaria socialis]|uniref:EF-hand domain-containing protein n=1 Tax=Rotaria socialis TaxID=392032 RepID=A0A818IQH7_9BILA|nr:unnamed protein product [Rotaria socialis]CAF3369859.1 unnamed protein product [Rotaria socialis]CAF3521491.1 unnamed protein product [Rotaria socialis]CAF3527346.1 unnamed protein product [Rotaria socialis]CAF3594217.1 unnamed protein product [Rotaria socialis]
MGNKSGSYEELLDETKELLMKRTGMSQYDLELWYKAILDRSKKGKLSKEQMLAIYTEMSDLDPMRISEIVDSIEKIFDEDHSGSVDINEFMRGFILTTKGDLETKVEYTFRVYDKNGDNKISGDEIKKMANAILRMLGSDEKKIDGPSQAIVQQFLGQFTGGENGVIYKQDFIQTVLQNRELLAVLSPFYACSNYHHHPH